MTVDEDAIADAIMLLLERTKLVVEGAGAVGVAALRRGPIEPAESGTTVVVLSGGNIDTGVLADIARHHETERGRRLRDLHHDPRRAGIAGGPAHPPRRGRRQPDRRRPRPRGRSASRSGETGVELVMETRGPEHAERLLATITEESATSPTCSS